MILAIGNIKGGVGKTTLAVNIAIARSLAGKDVLLVDGDQQQTAMTFTEIRTEKKGNAGYTAVSLSGAALRTQVRQMQAKYDDVIIDVGGRDTGSLRASLTVAQTLLIPVQPRSFDIWAIEQMADVLKEAREINDLNAFAMINAADAQGHDNEDAIKAIEETEGMTMLKIMMGRRKAFPNAAALGLSVLEHTPRDPKAAQELTDLIDIIYNQKIEE
jgi:chromosome partitioning protein